MNQCGPVVVGAARRFSDLCWVLALALFMACLCPPAAWAQGERTEYYALDALGSVRVVFDVNGAVVGRMDYAPFGDEHFNGLFVPAERFADLKRDGEAGLDYAEARLYQPRSGRFNAPDSLYSGLFEPQRWNRYGYALNNPLTFIDPTGLQAQAQVCSSAFVHGGDGEPFRQVTTCSPAVGGGGGGLSFDMALWALGLGRTSGGSGAGTAVDQEPRGGWVGRTQVALDVASVALDLTGVGTVVSPVVDLANAGISLATGDTAGAGLSVAAAIPFLGSSANVARLTRAAQATYPLKAAKTELHHITPIYLGGAANGPRVAINAAYHQLITNAFREAWPYGSSLPTTQELGIIMNRVYSQVPLPPGHR